MRCGFISVHFEEARTERTIHALNEVRERLQDAPALLIANSQAVVGGLAAAASRSRDRTDVMVHDNIGREFGGYQRGVEHFGSDVDWIVFANDTFSIHQRFRPDYAVNLVRELGRDVGHPIAVGQIESLRRSFVLQGRRTHRWITTNIFALNAAALSSLHGHLYDADLDREIVETGDASQFFSPAVDEVLRDHLAAWLFGGAEGGGWYGAAPLRMANAGVLAGKARSILQEKRLAAWLEDASAEMVDVRGVSLVDELRRRIRRRLRLDPGRADGGTASAGLSREGPP